MLLESNPLKPKLLEGGLGVLTAGRQDSFRDIGVREIRTHPTCGQCRIPPIPRMSMFTDMRKVSAIGL